MKYNTEYESKYKKYSDITILKFGDLYRAFSKTPTGTFYKEPDVVGRFGDPDCFYRDLPKKWIERMGTYYGYNYSESEILREYGELKVKKNKLKIPNSILSIV